MLKFDRVSHSFGGRAALAAVTAEFARGQLVAIVGRNGSGKSTLLRIAAGLLRATSGSAQWHGDDLSKIPPLTKARRIAFVPQQSGLAIDLTVREVVSLGLVDRLRTAHARDRVDAALDAVGVGTLATRAFHALSSGERQSCVLARALAQHEPNGLLVLDEPCANLDPAQTRRVCAALRACAREGSLVIAAMHDLPIVERVAQQVLWLDKGAVVAQGKPHDAFQLDTLERVFGCPFERATSSTVANL